MTYSDASLKILTGKTVTHAEAALAIARAYGPVLPLCYTNATGQCACGGTWDRDAGRMVPHVGHDLGKAPIGKLVKTGLLEATTNSATIDRWWRAHPQANVGLALKPARIVFVDPDSPAALEEAHAAGVEDGVIRSSRNVGYLFNRPDGCPVINISKSADHTELELRADGYAVVWGIHQDGTAVSINLYAQRSQRADAPSWTVKRLVAKAAEKAAQDAVRDARRAERATRGGGFSEPPVRLVAVRDQRRWSGDLVQLKDNGEPDLSDSLYFIGLVLAECGASESTIRAAVEERDATLGWNKYTDRTDADDRYQEIAEKTVAWVVNKARQPQLRITTPADVPDDLVALRTALEDANSRITYLERALMDRDDRLEILEPIVNQIDAIIQRPDEELCSDDKIVDIGLIRWLPYHQAKREAKGQPPTVALGYLSKVIGMPKKRISKSLERQSSNDPDAGAPFRKHVTRRFLEDEQRWESSMEVQPWGETPVATLRAAATFTPEPRPKRGGSKEASDARWGRCDKHDNDVVRVKGFCPDCGKVVGERMVTLAEFDALNVQVGHSEETAPHGVVDVLVERHLGHSDPTPAARRPLNVQVVDSGEPPTSLLDYVTHRPTAPPKCACGCMEYAKRSDGWRCLKCSAVYDPPLLVAAGGAE
jgi:hypothetical protein